MKKEVVKKLGVDGYQGIAEDRRSDQFLLLSVSMGSVTYWYFVLK
jgi:hypothetical protein